MDGGAGDIDGVENGIIVSLMGIGYFDDEIPPPDGEAGFGAMGSCFIATCSKNKGRGNVSLGAASDLRP